MTENFQTGKRHQFKAQKKMHWDQEKICQRKRNKHLMVDLPKMRPDGAENL